MTTESSENNLTKPQPSAKLTPRQWDLICFVEEFWHEYKAFPRLDVIKGKVFGYSSAEDVEEDIYLPHVRKRLTNRGIDYSVVLRDDDDEYKPDTLKSRLSPEQLAAISVMLNPFDRRSLTKKLAELGIRESTLNGWMKSKRFSDYFKARSEELFSDGIPIAHSALMEKVADGDMKAIKLFYEVSGRHTGVNKQETANLKLVIARLIEIMQRHCDTNTMMAITREIGVLMDASQIAITSDSQLEQV